MPYDSSTHSHIHNLSMIYDEAIGDSSDTIQQWASFESALVDVSGTNILLLEIILTSKDIAKEIFALLLSGKILSHLHGDLGQVQLRVWDKANKLSLYISPLEDIFASTRITLDGETVELDAAERAEWLLSRSGAWYDNYGVRQPWNKREEYVQGLLLARAAAAAATTDAGASTGPSTADEARGAASGCIQKTADEGEAGDEEDVAVDE